VLFPWSALAPGDLAGLVAAVTQDDVTDEVVIWLDNAWRAIVSIVLTIVVALIVLRLLRSGVKHIITRVLERQDQTPYELQQKAQTLASVIEGAGQLIVFIIAGIMILSSLGLDVAPLIASAGVAGLAIGLGAQSLIRDTINGFFILFENQYAVGDTVRIGADEGAVEEVSLRRTVLRSLDGSIIIIPNGQVAVVQNQSRGWSRALIDISVAAQADAAQVTDVLNELLADVQSDPVIGSLILERPEVLGVAAIDALGATFRVRAKTQPMQQLKVERELRRRIWQAFREHDIPTPVLTSATIPTARDAGSGTRNE
jgi:small conductance mechanosensitive channel